MNNNFDQDIMRAILESLVDMSNNPTPANPTDSANLTDSANQTNPTSATTTDPTASIQPKNRCKQCKKKVGYLGFDCKCKGYFCSFHRYPEEHSCSYDHKTEQINKLIANNPKIIADKFEKL
jgi:predicted nucleic acid binding AN1-type Zn finger protein